MHSKLALADLDKFMKSSPEEDSLRASSPIWASEASPPRSRVARRLGGGPGGVRTTTAMHCGFKIFKMAAKVEKFRRLYALFFNRYSSFLR